MADEVIAITARPSHVPLVADSMRHSDKLECLAEGMSPHEMLNALLSQSQIARTVFCNGDAMAMFGVNEKGDVPVVWALTTEVVETHRKAFLRASKRIMHGLASQYPFLVQCVDARYERAVRWMRHLGWNVEDATHECGPFSLLFHRATFVGKR